MTINAVAEQRRAGEAAVDREQVKAIMRAAGLLVEPSAATLTSAARSTLTLAEAAEILSRGDGPSFSQQVDEERGPKA